MSRSVRQITHGVIKPVERIHHKTLGVQHKRQDRAEFFVQRKPESAMIVKALVARLQNRPAL